MKPIVTKNYLKLIVESSKQRVIEVFFKYPEKEFSLSDIAELARVAKPHLGKILTEFYNLGFIHITKLSNIWRIKANRQNPLYIKSKIVYNFNLIYQSNIVEFLEFHFNNPKAIILFGSLRKGDDISTSDIDLAVEVSGHQEYTLVGSKEIPQLHEFEKYFNKKIQLHVFTRKDIDINVFNNIANGIILSGFLEVYPNEKRNNWPSR